MSSNVKKGFVILLLLIFPFCKGHKNTKEKNEIKGGVKYVHNPEKPLKGVVKLQLEEKLKLDLEKIKGMNLSYPGSLVRSPDGNIFVMDSKTFNVYKISRNGELLKTFMKKGEGPGEFTMFPRLYIRDNRLMVASFQKFAEFDLEGDLVKEWKFEKMYNRVLPLKENLLMAGILKYSKEKGELPEKEIVLMEPGGKNKKVIFKSKRTGRLFMKIGKYRFSFSTDAFVIPDVIWAYNPTSDLIYLAESDKYKIYVKNSKGKTLMTIERDYTRIPFSDEDKEKIVKMVRKMPEDFLKALRDNLPDHLGALGSIFVTPSGYIIAKSVKAYNKFHFDVFSPQGEFLYTLELPEEDIFEWVHFEGNGIISTLREENDTFYYVEYRAKNLNEVFGK